MARTKSIASLKNKLDPKVRKKKRMQPLRQNKVTPSDTISNTLNINGTSQQYENDPKLKMESKVVVSKLSLHFEDHLKKNKRKKKVTFSIQQSASDFKINTHNRKMTIIRTKKIVMSNDTKPQEEKKTCW